MANKVGIQDGGSGHSENWSYLYFYCDCIICFHVCYHNYTYIQYLTSQIAIMNFSNNMREKIIYIFLIFWCQNVKNSDLFSKKIYYDYIGPFSQIDKVEFGEQPFDQLGL